MNFDKFTIRLHYLRIFFMLTKFQGDQRLIGMSSINCLNSSSSSLKEYIKIWVYRSNGKLHPIGMKLACILRPYRICNPTVKISKYEFNNKLLGGVIFFRITLCVTWTQPYIS